MCQLSIPTSCAECPVNTCVIDPAYTPPHSEASRIGGALGGICALFAMGAILYWFYRQRNRKAKEALQRMRANAKLRVAEGEKFRPGSKKTLSQAASNTQLNSYDPFQDGSQTASFRVNRNRDTQEDDEEAADEDTEWTELREDGLTAFRKLPGQVSEVLEAGAEDLKRKSIGAATHLSRITEGAEDDDDGGHQRCFTKMQRQTIVEEDESNSKSTLASNGRNDSRTVSMSSQTSDSHNDARRQRNPFADGSDAISLHSISHKVKSEIFAVHPGEEIKYTASYYEDNDLEPNHVKMPESAHRPTGSPLFDFHGKEKSDVRSSIRESSSLQSPLSLLVRKPTRPARKPDLNLLLKEASFSSSSRAEQSSLQSPESGTVFRESASFIDPNGNSSYEIQSGTSESISNELLFSNAYQQNLLTAEQRNTSKDRHLSTATASSAGSLAYAMSSPKIISPADGGGVQRMQLKQGKAQLIRVSSPHKEQEKDTTDHGKSYEARVRNPQSADFSMLEYALSTDKALPEKDTEGHDDDLADVKSLYLRNNVHVPEEVTTEREDELEEDEAPEQGSSLRTGTFPDFDEVRLQYELAKYPFKQGES